MPRFRPDVLRLDDRITPASGVPDPTFGTGGVAVVPVTDAANRTTGANAVAVQPDGKVVFVGSIPAAAFTVPQIFVARTTAAGQLDPTFGVGGVVRLPAGTGDFVTEQGNAVAVQPDGRILVAGVRSGRDVAVTRLFADGSVDTGFGTGGDVVAELGNDANGLNRVFSATALAVLPDRRILVGGSFDGNFAVLRLNFNGVIDPSFGVAGLATFGFDDLEPNSTFPSPRSDVVSALAVQPDGRIVVVGNTRHNPTSRLDFPAGVMAVARLTANGVLDTSFDGDGRKVIDFALGGGIDQATAVAVQPDGKVVVAGLAGYYTVFLSTDPLADMAVARLNTDGSYDTSFDTDGKQTVVFGTATQGRDSRAAAVVLTPAGQIVVGGTAADASSTTLAGPRRPATARLNADGSVDTTYGTNGRAVITSGIATTATDTIVAGTFSAPGRIVLAGSRTVANTISPQPIDPLLVRVVIDETVAGAVLVGGRADGSAVSFNPANGVLAATTTYPFFAGFGGTVRTATADVTGDGVPDFVGGAGPGGAPSVVVYDGKSGARLASLNAFESTFTGGVFVATGDVDADGLADVVVTPDQGGGPVVSVYSGAKLAAGQNEAAQFTRFFGIEDAAFRGGARPALGDVNGDGRADLVVSAGFLGGPRIALFNGATLLAPLAQGQLPPKLVGDFFAFEDTLRNGAFVAAGDVTGDGKADLAFGGGPGGGPRVRLLDGAGLLAAAAFKTLDDVPAAGVSNFFAGDANLRGGVRVALRDTNADGLADLLTGSGDGEPSRVRVYRAATLRNPSPAPDQTLDPFGGSVAGGVFVG